MLSTSGIDLSKKIRQGIVYNYLGKISSKIISFAVMVYVIRQLSVSDYGSFNLMHGVLVYFMLFTTLGLRSVLRRYIPEFVALRKYGGLKNIVFFSQLITFIFSVLAFVLVLIFAKPISLLLKIPNFEVYFQIFGLSILAMIQAELMEIVLRSLLLQKATNLIRICYLLLRSAMFVFVIYGEYGLKGLFAAELISSFILFCLCYLIYSNTIKFFGGRIMFNKNVIPLFNRRMLRYNVLSFLQESGATVFDVSTDFYIISAYLGTTAVGLYSFATKTTEVLFSLIPIIIGMDVIRAVIYAKYAANPTAEQLAYYFNILNKILLFFAIPILVLVIALGYPAISILFGDKYTAAYPILITVTTFYLINLLQYPLGLIMNALEKVEFSLYSRLFSIYNVIMDVVLIKVFGIMGVAIATGTTILFANIFIYCMLRKYVKLFIDWKSVSRIAINSLLMGIVIFILQDYVKNIVSIIGISLIGLGSYIVISLINQVFSAEERKKINNVIGKEIFHS